MMLAQGRVSDFDPKMFMMQLVIVFGSIALHEFGHAKSADAAGDPTPRSQGRVTLNPLAHFDPLGALMILMMCYSGYGIGWGKPVMVNASRMRNPKWDEFMSVLWGPLVNLLLAIAFALILRFVAKPSPDDALTMFCFTGMWINISLCLFNLIPIGPLDGHWLLSTLLPSPYGMRYRIWSRTTGTLVLFGIILADQFLFRNSGPGILASIIDPPRDALLRMLLGPVFNG